MIEIHEIDEFSEISNTPDTAINVKILSNIRKLDEKTEMERFVREIIHDPNETPHGPTEITDIMTSHVHVRGNKRLTAFVLKGKSFQKVSSKKVTHQFAKLRQIPHLNLMVFGAVGNIQDDAQKDFLQIAIDAGCDYLIIDAQDWARLFITYEKVCPKDGTTYDNTGTCKNGHVQDEGLFLEMEVREKIRYTIVCQKDVSHAGAKRYSATILLDRHYSKDVIKKIILEVTEKLKYSNYYRSEQIKKRWGKIPAHVVWLLIAYDLEDIRNSNWICRTFWVSKTLLEDMRPTGLNCNEKFEDIEVLWNDKYKSWKNFFERHSGSKEEVLEKTQLILKEMVKLAKQGINYFEKYNCGDISEDEFILKIKKIEPKITELYHQWGNVPMPPEDCKDYDQACQDIFTTVSNMFLCYDKKGLEIWSKQNRIYLTQIATKRFNDELERIRYEETKIH